MASRVLPSFSGNSRNRGHSEGPVIHNFYDADLSVSKIVRKNYLTIHKNPIMVVWRFQKDSMTICASYIGEIT